MIENYLNTFLKSQEFRLIMDKLRTAYFSGTKDINLIRRENIAFMSDLNFVDSVLKTVVLQTKANNNQENQSKNTFLFR